MGIAKQKKGWKDKNINHWVSMSIVSVLSLLSVVFPSRGSCSCLMSPCPHMTCLKNVNYRICTEVVYKQVGGCLISYNLQLVCIRKLEDIWLCYIHLGWFFLQNWQLAFWTIIFCKLTFRTMIPAPLVVVQKKQSRKKYPLSTLLSTFSGTFDLLSLTSSDPSLPRLSVIALIVTAEFSPSWTTPGTRPLVLLSWKMQFF